MMRLDATKISLRAAIMRIKESRKLRLQELEKEVSEIVELVRTEGDEAFFRFVRTHDSPLITRRSLFVPEEEIEQAKNKVEPEFVEALQIAKERIEDFHRRQQRESLSYTDGFGNTLAQRITAIEKVGCCVPGKRAPLPSSLLMTVIPARVAGVPEVMVMSPPSREKGEIDAHILAAAAVTGTRKMMRAGGAHGVAAMAFGTETVPRMKAIVGPGNVYVSIAKKLVCNEVAIDSFAGPSEIMIVADETADAELLAAEMLAQAEHDQEAAAILVSDSESVLAATEQQLHNQLETLSTARTAKAALDHAGALVHVHNLEEAVELANEVAPEHLLIATQNGAELSEKIRNVGTLLLGEFSSEVIADYVAGPSHCLPTAGGAAFSSGISVDTFLKRSNIVSCSKEGLRKLASPAIILAQKEGMAAHAEALKKRLEKLEG